MKKLIFFLTIVFLTNLGMAQQNKNLSLLIFSKTNGFRHDAIPAATEAFKKIALENKWKVEFTEDSTVFNSQNLSRFNVVVFLLTTGDILNDEEQLAFEEFFKKGGGLLTLHTGTDTEYKWPWYGELIGAHFIGHPPTQKVTLVMEDKTNPATKHFGKDRLEWEDEFYSFNRNPRPDVKVLISIDESTFSKTKPEELKQKNLQMGDHPLVWCREFDGGRVFHTGLGHVPGLYSNPLMIKHLVGAIKWVAGIE
ncbi:MAG: ThuA domain-containing protein [Bacteroidales bacterium]